MKALLCTLALAAFASSARHGPGPEALLSDMDADKDGRVSAEELYARFLLIQEQQKPPADDEMPELSEEEKRNIIEEFQDFDRNSDGVVDMDEIIHQFDKEERPEEGTLEAMDIEEGYRQAHMEMERQTVRLSDENGDGKLSPQEFLAYRHKLYPDLHNTMVPTWARLEMRQAMHLHDTNKDGHLDSDELGSAHDQLWYQTHPDLYDDYKEEL